MVKCKKFVYAKPFQGAPKLDNFKLEEEELPELQDGEILCEAIFLSIDPYMRIFPFHYRIPVGTTFMGGQVAKITESKCANFPKGKYVFGQFGWRTHTKVNVAKGEESEEMYLLPDFEDLPLSLALGALGMPGRTAYYGFFEFCQPKPGETVVVTAAAGAVGSLVGQLAKIYGCKVIGLAGSEYKCSWLKNELGFDEVINYKTANIGAALKKAAPNGVDCYFDNVGGEISSIILRQMNMFGRISVCGYISSYNDDVSEFPKATIIQPDVLFKQLRIEGFHSNRWKNRRLECAMAMKTLIKDGKLKFRETITTGFESMPEAFIKMLEGKNIGKAIIKV